MIENGKAGANCATLRVVRAVNKPRYARLNDGAAAHSARLDGDVKGCSEQSIISENPCGFAEYHDFGMGSGVTIGNRAITGAGDEAVVEDQNRTDRHLAALRCFASFV